MNIISEKYLNLHNLKEKFHNNVPYPHIVLDDFLSDGFYNDLYIDNKNLYHNYGKKFETDFEKNKWISKNTQLPNKIKIIIDELNSENWIKNLSNLSSIESIFSTKVGNSHLANYHEMKNKGYLGPHVDHSDDPDTGNPHVLNILLYLSKDWKEDWGGSTLLFDKNGKKIIKEVQYKPNRAIIFLHTPYSFHGVKEIFNDNHVRSSIYVDYYSKSTDPYKSINLKFKNKWFKHGTCFVLPTFKDYFKIKNFKYTKTYLKYRFNRIISN
jgi:Rps23 Pro-64 3,4-dihydroxylase Tpa1-like proline 4-hydroxylase